MPRSAALFRFVFIKALPVSAMRGQNALLAPLKKEILGYSRCLTTFNNHFHKSTHKSLPSLQVKCSACHVRKFGTDSSEDVKFTFSRGLPVISVPLPSRKEMCKFTLRPVATTVADFLTDLKNEDKGVDRAVIFTTDGSRVAGCTRIEHLLQDPFVLHVNEIAYNVQPPEIEQASEEASANLDQTKILVAQLYGQLNIEEHQLKRQQALVERLDELKAEILPLEQNKVRLASKAQWRTHLLMWGGLALMGTQFGLLARLTWWEYSWDIMEPVTYFITYGTAIIMYGYFLLTQKEYIYPDARDRQYMRFFYRQAERTKFDVNKYNQLCQEICQTEQDLKRLRDPLQLNLPAEPIKVEFDPEGEKP